MRASAGSKTKPRNILETPSALNLTMFTVDVITFGIFKCHHYYIACMYTDVYAYVCVFFLRREMCSTGT